MSNIEQLRALVLKMREGLVLIDEQRAAIVKAIEDAEFLINRLENARAKS